MLFLNWLGDLAKKRLPVINGIPVCKFDEMFIPTSFRSKNASVYIWVYQIDNPRLRNAEESQLIFQSDVIKQQ
jgi:hypothetical protein